MKSSLRGRSSGRFSAPKAGNCLSVVAGLSALVISISCKEEPAKSDAPKEPPPAVGHVEAVVGNAAISRAGATNQHLQATAGMLLLTGDYVKTEIGAKLRIAFNDHS